MFYIYAIKINYNCPWVWYSYYQDCIALRWDHKKMSGIAWTISPCIKGSVHARAMKGGSIGQRE